MHESIHLFIRCRYGLSLRFRAQKYTVKLFFGFLDIALSNAWILWRSLYPKERKFHRRWMQRVADELINFNPLNEKVYDQPVDEVPVEERHLNVGLGFTKRGARRRRQVVCRYCSSGRSHLAGKMRRRTSYGCQRCNVGLHRGECHRAWHRLPMHQRVKARGVRRSMMFDESDSGYSTNASSISSWVFFIWHSTPNKSTKYICFSIININIHNTIWNTCFGTTSYTFMHICHSMRLHSCRSDIVLTDQVGILITLRW